jgi:hypothetical protein
MDQMGQSSLLTLAVSLLPKKVNPEKFPTGDHDGSSGDKWLQHIEYAAAAPLQHSSKLTRVS